MVEIDGGRVEKPSNPRTAEAGRPHPEVSPESFNYDAPSAGATVASKRTELGRLLNAEVHADSSAVPRVLSSVSSIAKAHVGGGLFARAREETPQNTAAVGIFFDVDPRHPLFLCAAAAVAVVTLTVWLGRKQRNNRRAAQRPGSGVEDGRQARERPAWLVGNQNTSVQRVHGVREDETLCNGGLSAGEEKTAPLTREQKSLCEVLYDVYAGRIPSGGIDNRAIKNSGLTSAAISKRFKTIERSRKAQARDRPGGHTPTTSRRTSSSSISPRAGRSKGSRGKATTKPKTPTEASKISKPSPPQAEVRAKKKSPSPKKRSTKRPTSARPSPSSPKSSGTPSKRPASAASTKASTDKTAAPSSPVLPRKKDPKAPSTTPKPSAKRAKSRSGKKPASPKPSTPSKRSSPAILEATRREAQMKVHSVAEERASALVGDSSGGVAPAVTRSKRAKKA